MEDYSAFAKALDPECFAIAEKPSNASPYQQDECSDKDAIQKKGYRDLAQSIRASNAAEEAAWLSYLQTRAAVVGAAFLVLTLAATAWAAWAAADAAKIADRSALAASNAVSQAAQANEIAVSGNRPWLAVDARIVPGTINYNREGLYIPVEFTFTNVGKSPATNVYFAADFVLHNVGTAIWDLQRQYCDDQLASYKTFNPQLVVVFQDRPLERRFGFSAEASVVEERIKWMGHPRLQSYIFGCVNYRSPITNEPHQTRFIFEFRQGDLPPAWGPVKDGEADNVSLLRDIRLVRYFVGDQAT